VGRRRCRSPFPRHLAGWRCRSTPRFPSLGGRNIRGGFHGPQGRNGRIERNRRGGPHGRNSRHFLFGQQPQAAQSFDGIDAAQIASDRRERGWPPREQEGDRLDRAVLLRLVQQHDEVVGRYENVLARANSLRKLPVDDAARDHRQLHVVCLDQLLDPLLHARPQPLGRLEIGDGHGQEVAGQIRLFRRRQAGIPPRMLAAQPGSRHQADHVKPKFRQLLQRFRGREGVGNLLVRNHTFRRQRRIARQPRAGIGLIGSPSRDAPIRVVDQRVRVALQHDSVGMGIDHGTHSRSNPARRLRCWVIGTLRRPTQAAGQQTKANEKGNSHRPSGHHSTSL
jgi:hypothetical protein